MCRRWEQMPPFAPTVAASAQCGRYSLQHRAEFLQPLLLHSVTWGLTTLTFPDIVASYEAFESSCGCRRRGGRRVPDCRLREAGSRAAAACGPAAVACGHPISSCRVDPGGHEQRD